MLALTRHQTSGLDRVLDRVLQLRQCRNGTLFPGCVLIDCMSY
jgi:hypothetical protein